MKYLLKFSWKEQPWCPGTLDDVTFEEIAVEIEKRCT